MDILKVELGRNIIIIFFMLLFSCTEKKEIENQNNDNLSIEILSVEKKDRKYNVLLSIDNKSNTKYVMLNNYHGFERKANYPKIIFKNGETIIDYNFFFKDSVNNNQDSFVNDPPVESTNVSFTVFILPKGKSNILLKNITLFELTKKNYLYLYFSKMREETFNVLPNGTKEYDIIANEKGFKNYEFLKKIVSF